MKRIQTFESFINSVIEEKSHVSENKPVDESLQFGSYHFNDRTSFGEHADDLPEKGESKFLVMSHTEVELDGRRYRLDGQHTSFGQGSKRHVIGIFDDEAYAMAAYNTAARKPEGAYVSFSMGTLTAKSKFTFSYVEKQGKLAKIKVK